MKLKVLGSVSPFAHCNSACPSYLIKSGKTRILLDCGSGSHRFFDMQADLDGLIVIISHLHKDHYNDLFNYLYTSFAFHNLGLISNKIQIYLPNCPKDIVNTIVNEKNCFADFHIYNESTIINIENTQISFCEIKHSKDVINFASKIECRGNSIVYSGDVSFVDCDKLSQFASKSDLLICESSLLVEHNFPEICNHLTAKQAGIIAKNAKVKKLLLTHFWPDEDLTKYVNEACQEFDNVVLAKENLELETEHKYVKDLGL